MSGSTGDLFSDKLRKALFEDQLEGARNGERSGAKANGNNFDTDGRSASASRKPRLRTESSRCSSKQGSVEGKQSPLVVGNGPAAAAQFSAPSQFSPLASPQQKHPPPQQQQQQPFSVAKKAILNKNQSASDLTQWINPDLLMRRRASLHQNAFDPMMKKVRQREAYKTAMCQAWLEGKPCVFGEQCNFAHGEEELQPLPNNRSNPKYKTRICENYTSTGICAYGNRCFFIHPQPSAKMEDLVEYQEQLNQTARQLEGEAIYRPAMGSSGRPGMGGTPQMVRRVGNKAKQFRKLESCGNFYTQYQLQELQMQMQKDQQAQAARQMEQQFYENFPPLSAAAAAAAGTGANKGAEGSRRASKNTAVTGSMPLIHSNSASDLNFHPFAAKLNLLNNSGTGAENNVNKGLEERRLTFRKMQSQKSFSSSDVWYQNLGPKPKAMLEMDMALRERGGEGSDSSGPHTPPGFYGEQSKWSSMSSTHPTHIWPGLDTAEQQKVPSFSLFGPSEQIGSCDMLRGATGIGGGVSGGKKSPISDFEGILMGRRSSHTPYLDEGENAQALLNVVFEQGMQKGGRNRSAEFLIEGRGTAAGVGVGAGWLDPVNQWPQGARSTGALNTEKFAPWQTQFGPPEGGIASASQQYTQAYLQQQQQLAEFQQQQQMLANYAAMGGGGGTSAYATMMCHPFQQQQNQQQQPSHPIGANPSSVFRPIRQIQQQMYLEQQSPYSSNSSVHATSLADELIRQSSNNLDVMRQLWASSSPELDKSNEQEQQPRFPLWSQLGQEDQKVVIPSKLEDFYTGVAKRNEALERMLKESKPESALSRNDTLTDSEKEEPEKVEDQQQQELNKLCESLSLYDSSSLIAGTSSANAVEGQIINPIGYEAVSGAWAKRAMTKAFLRQKSHSSPAISRTGSLAEKELAQQPQN